MFLIKWTLLCTIVFIGISNHSFGAVVIISMHSSKHSFHVICKQTALIFHEEVVPTRLLLPVFL